MCSHVHGGSDTHAFGKDSRGLCSTFSMQHARVRGVHVSRDMQTLRSEGVGKGRDLSNGDQDAARCTSTEEATPHSFLGEREHSHIHNSFDANALVEESLCSSDGFRADAPSRETAVGILCNPSVGAAPFSGLGNVFPSVATGPAPSSVCRWKERDDGDVDAVGDASLRAD